MNDIAKKDAEITRLRSIITELALGIDAVQLDTCMQEDWDALNRSAEKAREIVNDVVSN